LLRALSQLCGESGLLPTSYELPGLVKRDEDEAYSVGGFADVWRGTHEGVSVALKVIRLHAGDREKVKKVFCREAVFWKRLSHANIVPFLGVSPRFHLCIVAEWMEYGDVVSFLKQFPLADRRHLVLDITRGLHYMHTNGIIHGDVKARNILVDGQQRARLGDFGLATTVIGTETLASFTETSANRGSLRYMAPELLDHTVESVTLTTKTDVYGYGMALWEIFDGRIPFHDVRIDYVVVLKVKDGVRPSRPTSARDLGLDDDLWELIETCWASDPAQRPSMLGILQRLFPDALHGLYMISSLGVMN
ncbi:hypothetical protein PUNSTDRAFT_62220, partial [Punctularia strigosozonata HHB-11173 SS5]|uniref:uncharacterized protein n=1 Tax=Punctularia strigosozonata (strain HHB-11173) TaxID=741275 RepID=UPI00044171D4